MEGRVEGYHAAATLFFVSLSHAEQGGGSAEFVFGHWIVRDVGEWVVLATSPPTSRIACTRSKRSLGRSGFIIGGGGRKGSVSI